MFVKRFAALSSVEVPHFLQILSSVLFKSPQLLHLLRIEKPQTAQSLVSLCAPQRGHTNVKTFLQFGHTEALSSNGLLHFGQFIRRLYHNK